MSASLDLAKIVEQILSEPGALRVAVPILCRRKGEPANDIEAAVNAHQLCIYIMQPFPTEAMQGVPFLFYKKSELRIRISEQVQLNSLTANAYDLADDVALALHWQPLAGIDLAVNAAMAADNSLDQPAALAMVKVNPVFSGLFALMDMLAHPLQICSRPQEETADPELRYIDVLFEATYQLNKG